jgi:hypothetical protein
MAAKGLSGSTPIQNDGAFSNAAINEGSAPRTGCTGAWNGGTSTLVIDCGGTGTGQSCEATLTRMVAACN